jgi:hypothetical protein
MVLGAPDTVVQNGADVYIVDLADNRIEEIPGTSKTRWGRSMTAGDMYPVAGSTSGQQGISNGGSALSGFLLYEPAGLAFDSSGNMIISDSGNDRILVVPAASGTYFGVSMTAGNVYKIAGQGGSPGHSGDGGSAVLAFLNDPQGLDFGHSTNDLYIADVGNNRVQEIYEGGQSWGQSMTGNDIYTVAGSSSGSPGDSGDGAAVRTTRTPCTRRARQRTLAARKNDEARELAGDTLARCRRVLGPDHPDIVAVVTSWQGGSAPPACTGQYAQPEAGRCRIWRCRIIASCA